MLMGSASDQGHGEKIRNECKKFGFICEIRVTSAHKGTTETLHILAEYECKLYNLESFLDSNKESGIYRLLKFSTSVVNMEKSK